MKCYLVDYYVKYFGYGFRKNSVIVLENAIDDLVNNTSYSTEEKQSIINGIDSLIKKTDESAIRNIEEYNEYKLKVVVEETKNTINEYTNAVSSTTELKSYANTNKTITKADAYISGLGESAKEACAAEIAAYNKTVSAYAEKISTELQAEIATLKAFNANQNEDDCDSLFSEVNSWHNAVVYMPDGLKVRLENLMTEFENEREKYNDYSDSLWW